MATGKVTIIVTREDGTTEVTIQDENTNETFRHPDEMTDAQLEEFKRAQSNGFTVGVNYDEDPRKVRTVLVFNETSVKDAQDLTAKAK